MAYAAYDLPKCSPCCHACQCKERTPALLAAPCGAGRPSSHHKSQCRVVPQVLQGGDGCTHHFHKRESMARMSLDCFATRSSLAGCPRGLCGCTAALPVLPTKRVSVAQDSLPGPLQKFCALHRCSALPLPAEQSRLPAHPIWLPCVSMSHSKVGDHVNHPFALHSDNGSQPW